jgi:hypothetical protein
VLGAVTVLLVPVVLRRRYRLRPAGSSLDGAAKRIAELAAETGLRRPLRLMVGPAGQRDAFVYGIPGRYELVLPTALVVRWRDGSLFDPVVRHELAHLRRHDVTLAWLATSVWIAALPVLTVPLVLDLVRWDLVALWEYVWRVATVLGVVWLIRRQVLRSREHDADLHAARQAGDWRPVAAVLDNTGRPAPGWWRRLVSFHPTNARRIQVLADPGGVPGVSFVDGFTAAFLIAVLLPPVLSALRSGGLAGPVFGWSPHIAAGLVGPFAGLAIGVGLWRQAMIDAVTGARTWPGGVVLGVVLGLQLGRSVPLHNLDADGEGLGTKLLVVVIGAAAVLLSAGTGRLWADAAARLPGGRRSWWIGFLVNALIFAVALWAMEWLPVLLATQARRFSTTGLVTTFGTLVGPVVYVAAVPVLVTVALMMWRRRALPTPQWLVEGPAPMWSWSARRPGLAAAVLAGTVPGLAGALAVLLYRLSAGRPADTAEALTRYAIWLTVGTLIALTVSFVTLTVVPRSGGAVGLITGVSAAAMGALAMAATNTLVSHVFDPSFWWLTVVNVTTIWLAGYVLILPVTLAVWPLPWRDVPGWVLVLACSSAGGLMAFVAGVALLR